MKTVLKIVAFMLPLWLFGCEATKQQNVESKFEQDLRGLYSMVRGFGSQTLGVGEYTPLTDVKLEAIFTECSKIAQENGIFEQITKLGVYADLQNGNMPNYETWDMYDCLNWLEQNTTPAFMSILYNMLDEENISLDNVLSNRSIRDDEKLTLVSTMAIGYLTKGGLSMTRAGAGWGDCYAQYGKTTKNCNDAHTVWSYVSVVVGCFSAPLGVIAFALGEGGYYGCLDQAKSDRNKCMGV